MDALRFNLMLLQGEKAIVRFDVFGLKVKPRIVKRLRLLCFLRIHGIKSMNDTDPYQKSRNS